MRVTHEKPAGWVDTGEPDLIQPSAVADLVHVIELEEGDLMQGPPGADGAPGAQGIQGDKGDAGDAGAQGLEGIPGAEGAQGPAGAVGPAGPAGGVGPAGPAGADGAPGAPGVQGLKGDKGDKGDAGAAGAQGAQGVPGAAGAAGAQGIQGVQGIQGAQGAQGVAPAGAVLHFAMAAAPAGWLVCDGSLKLRATYAALFAAIGVLYGAGDGATTFALPDLRGEFLRGLDGGRNVDAGRALGSAQADAFKSHTHSMGLALSQAAFTAQNPALLANGSAQTAATGGAETRPRNIALLACISTGA